MKHVFPTVAVVISALVACSGSTIRPADSKQLPVDSVSAVAADPSQQLDELTVAARGSMDGYNHDKYLHWIHQGDNCNTRKVVLKPHGEGVKPGSDCYPTSGTWTSPYDGASWSDPSDVDIDHTGRFLGQRSEGVDERRAFGVRQRPDEFTTVRGHGQREPVEERQGAG